jgi:ATP-dependent 26S proteasome regulatory subunit
MSYNSELFFSQDEDGEENGKKYIDLPLNNEMTMVSETDEIYCQYKFEKTEEESSDSSDSKKNMKVNRNSHYMIVLSIKMKSDDYTAKMNRFVDQCVRDYDEYVLSTQKKNENIPCIYSFLNSEKVDNKIELHFSEFPMDHNKDLNINIFFEQKKKLIQYINPFVFDPLLASKENPGEQLYKKCGMTFKAGLLFYGEPGCGKTTTIKGILKYTNRNAIIVDLGKVKTCEELESIFRTRKINGKVFTGKELCFILEDCDAFDTKVIKKRENEPTTTMTTSSSMSETNSSDMTKLMDKLATTTMTVLPPPETDRLNLSCLLNLLDGIIELNGIMIIMTSNHPEKIDPALIRPGRFDFKCEFKKASREIIKEMLKLKYNLTDQSLLKYATDLNNIKDYMMSPAQIQCICFNNERIEECISEIILESQS